MFEAFEFLGRYLLIAIQWVDSSFIHNIALSTIIFTVIIKLLALPADVKQRQSMAKMTALNPELQKIQKRYESNPETLQRKTQELYRKSGTSPYASCLPMLITMLIFMIFLGAMRTWSYVGTIDIYQEAQRQQTVAAEAGEPLVVVKDGENDHLKNYKWAWVNNIWMPDSFLENSVMKYEQFSKMPFQKLGLFFDENTLTSLEAVSEEEFDKVMQPYFDAYSGVRNGWGILPVLAGASMLLMQFIQKKLNPQQQQAQPAQSNPANSNTMMIIMAGFSVWVCFSSNTAFSLYWLASNVVSLFTTLLLSRYTKKKTEEIEAESGNITIA